ncbi:MAG: hypothetical protein A2Y76_02060 [Planctomycetes bacterium RBG_13_60_9]|nr:MAG: hypothetical protein A2Y76_02060 [Planctomycetes bacterium RBG_13_60_9]
MTHEIWDTMDWGISENVKRDQSDAVKVLPPDAYASVIHKSIWAFEFLAGFVDRAPAGIGGAGSRRVSAWLGPAGTRLGLGRARACHLPILRVDMEARAKTTLQATVPPTFGPNTPGKPQMTVSFA